MSTRTLKRRTRIARRRGQGTPTPINHAQAYWVLRRAFVKMYPAGIYPNWEERSQKILAFLPPKVAAAANRVGLKRFTQLQGREELWAEFNRQYSLELGIEHEPDTDPDPDSPDEEGFREETRKDLA